MTRRLAVIGVLATLSACGPTSAPTDAADVAANNRGVGLMGMFEYAKAHDVFRTLVEEHPDWVEVSVNLAIADPKDPNLP